MQEESAGPKSGLRLTWILMRGRLCSQDRVGGVRLSEWIGLSPPYTLGLGQLRARSLWADRTSYPAQGIHATKEVACVGWRDWPGDLDNDEDAASDTTGSMMDRIWWAHEKEAEMTAIVIHELMWWIGRRGPTDSGTTEFSHLTDTLPITGVKQ